MKAFLILAAVAAIGSARPEGYSYNAPGGGLSSGSLYTSIRGFGSGGIGGFSSGGNGFSSGGSGFSSGGSGFSGGFGGGYGIGGTTLVQKHIYVHVPPPETEEQHPQILGGGVPQKHYKIIFIKAPSPPAPITPVIPAQAQNEEKTLVYVLVKKPEEQGDITIPTAAPTQPSKPEVYFIKYKAQKEGGIGGGSIGGISGGSIGGHISGGSVGSAYGAPVQSGSY
ncbi:RNA-binding protein cabeza-like [Cydia strobilella]|uniref:RNA-binding protein cabeza-like n=1 Tax=Cydia strobilella TaxID=1100964 RepID=UPI003003BF84